MSESDDLKSTPRDSTQVGANPASEDGHSMVTELQDGEAPLRMTEDGYSVYEPPPLDASPSSGLEDAESDKVIEESEEWAELGKEIFERYGDSLGGANSYIGPIGGLLTALGGVVLVLSSLIESAKTVIGIPFLLTATGVFVIGLFLLLFHLFHLVSNRNKAAALAELNRERLLDSTCIHLDIEFAESLMTLHCRHFDRELSDAPECVICPHHDPIGNETLISDKREDENDQTEMFTEEGREVL